MEPVTTRIEVRYAEIDGQRVVFNSRYLEYADVAVSAFWQRSGLSAIAPEFEVHVRHAEVDYRLPLRHRDRFDAAVTIERVGTTSFVQRVEMRHADTGVLHNVVRLTAVHVDLDSGRSAPLPAAARAMLERHLAR